MYTISRPALSSGLRLRISLFFSIFAHSLVSLPRIPSDYINIPLYHNINTPPLYHHTFFNFAGRLLSVPATTIHSLKKDTKGKPDVIKIDEEILTTIIQSINDVALNKFIQQTNDKLSQRNPKIEMG